MLFAHSGVQHIVCCVFVFFVVVVCTLCRRLVYPLLPDCPFVYFVIHIAVMILTYVIYNEMVSFPVKPQSTL